MKTLTLAAALMLGTAAFAQTTPQSTMPQSGTTTPDTMGTAGTTTGTMQTPPTDTGTMPSTTGTMGTNGTTGTTDSSATMAAPAATATPMAAGTYPRCSRTVVDQCIQGPGRERDTPRSRRRG